MNFRPGLLKRKPSDRRFLRASLAGPETYIVPAHIDLRSQLLSSSDQGSTSKCVWYGIAGLLEFYAWKYRGVTQQVDPNPGYTRSKLIDGEPNEPGTTLEAGVQAAQDLGLITPAEFASIRAVSNALEVKQALHRYGVVLGAFDITDKWSEATAGGWIPPGGNRVGGHCVLLCGYSTAEVPNWYGIQNSWGQQHGWRGFNRMSPEVFEEQFMYGLVLQLKNQ